MHIKISLAFIIIIISAGPVKSYQLGRTNAPLVINEFMASNSTIARDPQGQYDDWIELYNYGSVNLDIGRMYLTDNLSIPTKWQIPTGTIIAPGAYLLIWADQDTSATGLHANFKLNAAGEEIGLFSSDGETLIDNITFGEQITDISYGRFPDAGEDWHFLAEPTPAAENNDSYSGEVADTKFSHNRGFYDASFRVTITTKTAGAIIRYTTDGSTPTENYGQVYTGPVLISTTTCLRAMAYKPGLVPTNVDAQTYIFLDDVARQPADPPGWPSDWGYSSDAGGIVPSDYEMDQRVVNTTQRGYSVRDALLDIPTMSISMLRDDFISDTTGIYANPQSRWERQCSVEYIFPDGTEGFQHNCKIEIHGNASRRPYRMQKHSLRLTFTGQYGPSKLKYQLFPESDVDEFNQLVLRASFTDSWALVSWSSSSRYRPNDSQYIHDVWMKESLHAMGQPSSHGNFVHLYVNGLYFGLYNLSERVSEDFFADHLGGKPEDWEINEDLSSPDARWNAMMSVNPATPAGYMQIQDYLDVENFADYMLLHFYADAEDWPHHNGYAAANPVSGDGKYRFFVWDQEIVLDYHGRAASRIDSTGGAGSLFQKMRTSDEFRLLFSDRVYKHCFNDGALSVAVSQDRYLAIANQIDKAIVAESARWGDTQMSTPYGNAIEQPNPPTDINHNLYPPAPHGPDYYFTREDSWVVERDNVIDNYIPAIHDTTKSYAIINVLRAEDLYPDFDPPIFYINGSDQHGGQIMPNDQLSMIFSSGTVYYTLDGSDPRVPQVADGSDVSTTLISESAEKRVLVPTGDIGTNWRIGAGFNDSAWLLCTGSPGGVGYEISSGYENLISLDVEDRMYNRNTACYIRIPFTFNGSTDEFNFMTLKVRYDDGFVAYLNGVEVARRNFNGTPVWGSSASASHSDDAAVQFESIDISASLAYLRPGYNLLAIHGLNTSLTSTDFLISAELIAGKGSTVGAGEISPSAIRYSSPITLPHSARVKARVLNGNTWSAMNEAVFAIGDVAENLRITEIMYHPQQAVADANDPNEEYIELTNVGTESVNLNLVKFTNGINFIFPNMELFPDEYAVVIEDRDTFEAQYGPGINIAGQYSGKLNNNGERIRLEDAIGQTILDFSYKDDWFDITDGEDFSLTIIDPANLNRDSWNQKDSWRPSAYSGGSPGTDDNNF